MTEEEIAIRQRLKNDFAHYADKCLRIRDKDGKVHPFALNRVQTYLHQKLEEQKDKIGKVRAVVLKGRQQGCSTYVEGNFFHEVTHRKGVRAFILTHEQEATNNLFEMVQRFYDHCPEVVRPAVDASNAKELYFGGLDSGYKVGTAGNKSVGRSSTIQLFHGSEVAYWPNAGDHAGGIMQAIPDAPGTKVILESTANGIGNYFHEQWQKAESGESEYIAVFLPWYWQDEYRKQAPKDFTVEEDEAQLKEIYKLDNDQLYWRRTKIAEMGGDLWRFKQDYPCCAAEAFQTSGDDSFIDPQIVMRARNTECAPEYGALLVGVDPAHMGKDRTSIIRRRGRNVYKLEYYSKKDTMQVAGLCTVIIQEEKPAKMFIDVTGIGAGVVDRLREMGFSDIVVPVNSASSPLDDSRYCNKRAEMWGKTKEFLQDEPCKIPNDDALHADLCAPIIQPPDSKGRLVIEKKENIKRRGLRSPDGADALALTFAYPVAASQVKKQLNYIDIGIV
jgi:hypothetical protein